MKFHKTFKNQVEVHNSLENELHEIKTWDKKLENELHEIKTWDKKLEDELHEIKTWDKKLIFSITYFFIKYDEICRNLWICLDLLKKKSQMRNVMFYAVIKK